MNKQILVYVGFSDGRPHVYDCEEDGRCVAVYPTRKAAREKYEDVRRAVLTIDQPKRRGKGKSAVEGE
jgi:hypothetical protein